MAPIKVVIADDHTLFREGLKRILSLEKDLLVVGEAFNGEHVVKVVERVKPDVLLLDLQMPKGDVVDTLLQTAGCNPSTKVIVLTAFSEQEDILNAAKGGARGYVLKGASSSVLLEAIKTVQRGGVWVDSEVPGAEAFDEIARAFFQSDEKGPVSIIRCLTKREIEILKLVAEGLTNDEIGKKIFISEKTVKTHLTNIFAKLNVTNRFKAALLLMHESQPQSAPSSIEAKKNSSL